MYKETKRTTQYLRNNETIGNRRKGDGRNLKTERRRYYIEGYKGRKCEKKIMKEG